MGGDSSNSFLLLFLLLSPYINDKKPVVKSMFYSWICRNWRGLTYVFAIEVAQEIYSCLFLWTVSFYNLAYDIEILWSYTSVTCGDQQIYNLRAELHVTLVNINSQNVFVKKMWMGEENSEGTLMYAFSYSEE